MSITAIFTPFIVCRRPDGKRAPRGAFSCPKLLLGPRKLSHGVGHCKPSLPGLLLRSFPVRILSNTPPCLFRCSCCVTTAGTKQNSIIHGRPKIATDASRASVDTSHNRQSRSSNWVHTKTPGHHTATQRLHAPSNATAAIRSTIGSAECT